MPRAVLAIAVAAAALSGCGSSSPARPTPPPAPRVTYLPNIAAIQQQIAAAVQARGAKNVTVLCPTVVPDIAGGTFECVSFFRQPSFHTLRFLVTLHGGTYVTFAETTS